MSVIGFLRPANDGEYYLRGEKYPESNDGYLYSGPGLTPYGRGLYGIGDYQTPASNDGYLRREGRPNDAAIAGMGTPFPTQYSGLRVYSGSVLELCMVAISDAPAGDQWRVSKGGTTYAVYLVDTTDTNASPVRIKTQSGIKAARLKV